MPEKSTVLPRSKLYLKTILLLKTRPNSLSLARIAKDTGLTERWITTIVAKSEISPSVDRIELLYNYLTGTTLDF